MDTPIMYKGRASVSGRFFPPCPEDVIPDLDLIRQDSFLLETIIKAFIDNTLCKDFVVIIIGSAASTVKRIECNTLCYRAVRSTFTEVNVIKLKQNADIISSGCGGIVLGKPYTTGKDRIKKVGSETIIVADREFKVLKLDVSGRGQVIGVIKHNTIQASRAVCIR